jgi:hypothetical protein
MKELIVDRFAGGGDRQTPSSTEAKQRESGEALSPVEIVVDLCETYGIGDVAGDEIRKQIERTRVVVSAQLIPWEAGMQGVDITFSDGYRVALPITPSVSDEHSQSEDAVAAECEACQRGGDSQTPVLPQTEGEYTRLIEATQKADWSNVSIGNKVLIQGLCQALEAHQQERDEADRALNEERERYLKNDKERVSQLQAHRFALEALQQKNKDLEESLHYANGVADLAMKHRDEAEAQLEALRSDLEPKDKALEPFAAAMDYQDIQNSGTDDDEAIVKTHAACKITMGHLRTARSALSPEKEEGR